MGYWRSEKFDYRTQKQKDLEDQIKLLKGQLGASTEKHKVDPASLVWATFRSHERREANADTPERWIPYHGAPTGNHSSGKMYRISQRHLDAFGYWQKPTASDFIRNGISEEKNL